MPATRTAADLRLALDRIAVLADAALHVVEPPSLPWWTVDMLRTALRDARDIANEAITRDDA